MMTDPILQNLLHKQYSKLKRNNPRYSLRAFSKKVGVSPGTLSLILSGRRNVSAKLGRQIVINIISEPLERAEVLSKLDSPILADHKFKSSNYAQLEADRYHLLVDWVNFAILNLVKLDSFKNEPSWIARRLNIPEKTVVASLNRLIRMEMLIKNERGQLSRRAPSWESTRDQSNNWLKESHHATLDLGHEKLDEVEVTNRDFTWITFPMSQKSLLNAKAMIRKFQDQLLEIVQKENKPDEVYRMAVQLYPLTNISESKGEAE